jgi:hypothetical protein
MPIGGVELAKPKGGLLRDHRARVVVLESQPGDVGMLVVVTVDVGPRGRAWTASR